VAHLLLFAWRKAVTVSDLRPPLRLTAFALSAYMNTDGIGARPSMATLAADTGYHVDTVRRHVRDLEATGWLLVEPSKGGPHRTNRWRAHIPRPATPVDNPSEQPPHQRGGSKRNPRASVGQPPRGRGGISYELLAYKVENNYLVVPRGCGQKEAA